MRKKLIKALQEHPRSEMPALPGRTNHIKCGVLVPINLKSAPIVYVGQRSNALNNHAGELCFPGGRQEAHDENLAATALREAHEEMGIRDVDLIGRLSSMPLYTSDYRLEPYVGILSQAPKSPDGNEIIRIHSIDLTEVLCRPRINCIPWESNKGLHLSPIFEVDDRLMFGATAYVFLEFLELMATLLELPVPEKTSGLYQWEDVLPGIS